MNINRVWKPLRLGVIGGSLLSPLTIVGLCRPQETAEQFVERVKEAIKNDEWGRAKSGVQHALALKPESAEANLIAAQVYWYEGARSMAIDALKKAITIQPFFPEAHFLLAQCLKENNQLGGAREEANIAINQGASLFPAYRLLAEIDVGTVLLLRGLGHGLDEQATEVARNLKFAPATRNGKAIPYWMKITVEFNLR